jgi:3-oxoadipate enol-lactonase
MTVVLVHSLGADRSLWDPQLPALGAAHEVVAYDLGAPPASIADIGRDVLALAPGRFHVVGLSMGGQVAQWLALNAPGRVDRIVLACTGARIATPGYWDERIAAVRAGGLEQLVAASAERWFTAGFRARAPEAVARARARLLGTPPATYIACCAAIRDFDAREAVAAIRAPTLVLTGAADPVTPPADGRLLAERIPGARSVELDAAHLANIEAADAFNAAVLDFLGG